ncbi:kynurenine formamidase-like protein [Haematococcus lacustris]
MTAALKLCLQITYIAFLAVLCHGDDTCGLAGDVSNRATEEPGFIEITVPIAAGLPIWSEAHGMPSTFRWLAMDMAKGAFAYDSHFTLGAHVGTHVDSVAHFLPSEYEAGNTIDKVPLAVLVGPSLVLQVPPGVTDISASVLQELNIPSDCQRLLLRTDNTLRKLMYTPAWTPDYAGLTADGAQWLALNTSVELVGIDYLSIGNLADIVGAHLALFTKGIIPVEGLDLTPLQSGRWYHLTCLPLKIQGAEGAPARCVAWGPDNAHEQARRPALEDETL